MEITKTDANDLRLLKISGRLDAYWADHLMNAVDDEIRQGFHRIELNLAAVDYLSSAGIRVLLKAYKQLKKIGGTFSVAQPSEAVLSILEISHLTELLSASAPAPSKPTVSTEPKRKETASTVFHIFEPAPGAAIQCQSLGDPSKLETSGFSEADCTQSSFPESTFGLGLGAFGNSFADCQERFGEFIALAGSAVYLPTDGTNVPDYMVSEGALVPELKILYGLSGQGRFAYQIRFEAKPEPPGVVPLSEIINAAFEITNAPMLAFAMVNESAGLVGASLKRSAASPSRDASPLSFPAVRDWLSFSQQRVFDRSLTVVVGIAAQQAPANLLPFLRPIAPASPVQGHFHAAVFPYRPIQRGELNLHQTVQALFTHESVAGLLHLLSDDRTVDGIGESEFLRGACWAGPIHEFTARP